MHNNINESYWTNTNWLSEDIGLEEFCGLVAVIDEREGFSKAEYERAFLALFFWTEKRNFGTDDVPSRFWEKHANYMGVSENGGTPKSSHFNRVFH